MTKAKFPTRGAVYTFAEIEKLPLRDSAFLRVCINDICGTVQDSEGDLSTSEVWMNSRWKFLYETDEWIPIFEFHESNTVLVEQIVDFEIHIDPHADKPSWWVTPKGFPRPQFYRIVSDDSGVKMIANNYSSELDPIPDALRPYLDNKEAK